MAARIQLNHPPRRVKTESIEVNPVIVDEAALLAATDLVVERIESLLETA